MQATAQAIRDFFRKGDLLLLLLCVLATGFGIVVIASADTHIVTTQVETDTGRPNIWKKPPTALPKIWNGVPLGRTPFDAAAQAMTNATTPSSDSTNIAP